MNVLFVEKHSATRIQVRSVLVATDFSKASEKALRHGVDIARYYHSKLYLAHVVSPVRFSKARPESQSLALNQPRESCRAWYEG